MTATTKVERADEQSSVDVERILNETRERLRDKSSQLREWKLQREQIREAIGERVAGDFDVAELRSQLRDADDTIDGLERACVRLEADVVARERELEGARSQEARAEARRTRECYAAMLSPAVNEIDTHALAILKVIDEMDAVGSEATQAGYAADQVHGQQIGMSVSDREWVRFRKENPGSEGLPRFVLEVRAYLKARSLVPRN